MGFVLWLAAAYAGTEHTFEIVDEKIFAFEGLGFERDESLTDLAYLWQAKQDDTDPEIAVWVLWTDRSGVLHDEGHVTTDKVFSIPFGSYVLVSVSATESSGGAIRDVVLAGELESSCGDDVYEERVSALIRASNPDPDPNDDELYGWRNVLFDFDVPPFGCSAGMWFLGGYGQFGTSTVNHAGLVTRGPTIAFDLIP